MAQCVRNADYYASNPSPAVVPLSCAADQDPTFRLMRGYLQTVKEIQEDISRWTLGTMITTIVIAVMLLVTALVALWSYQANLEDQELGTGEEYDFKIRERPGTAVQEVLSERPAVY